MSDIHHRDKKRARASLAHTPQGEQQRRSILIVGGDSVGVFRDRNTRGRGSIEHFSGRKRRDLARPIPQHTEVVIVVLDRVSHALARKIRIEAGRRRLPIVYQKRAHVGGQSAGLAQLRTVRKR